MKKAILISIKPEWVEKILNGVKPIEIRKSMPKCELPIDVYIYVTKSKPYLQIYPFNIRKNIYRLSEDNFNSLNGKVVAKFTLNKVWNFKVDKLYEIEELGYNPYGIEICSIENVIKPLIEGSCLNLKEMYEYAPYKNLYAWHIENLQIFDKPMELIQFEKYCDEPDDLKPCCNGKHCIHESYDWCENQSCCDIDYDGADCPYLKVNKPPRSWQYIYIGD